MAIWRIERSVDGAWVDTGERYNDAGPAYEPGADAPVPLTAEEFAAKRSAEDGWTYRAVPPGNGD